MGTRPLCIYHGNCADGFASAWVVRRALDGEVNFHPGVYQDPPPDVEGRDVFLVDFSYKRDVVLKMAKAALSITIIDHHKSALDDLQNISQDAAEGDYCPVTLEGALDYSGATLTWRWFYGSVTPPRLLSHIEDRDLWRFRLPGTRQIQAAIFSYPYDFELYDKWMDIDDNVSAAWLKDLAIDGRAIERKHFKDIAELARVVTRRIAIGGYDVPVANLPYTLTSDAGHALARGEPFAACYWDTPAGRVFSLRSQDDGLDVSKIAALYGGGGHPHAAGFRVDWRHPLAHWGDIDLDRVRAAVDKTVE